MISELPYSISIVSRKTIDDGVEKCVYCLRQECDNCPLPFDDKTTLGQYLNKVGVAT